MVEFYILGWTAELSSADAYNVQLEYTVNHKNVTFYFWLTLAKQLIFYFFYSFLIVTKFYMRL